MRNDKAGDSGSTGFDDKKNQEVENDKSEECEEFGV